MFEEEEELNKIFEKIILNSKKDLKENGELSPFTFFVFKNLETNNYEVKIMSMRFSDLLEKKMYSSLIRFIVSNSKDDKTKRLIAVIFFSEAFMSIKKADDYKKNPIQPSEDPDRKEILFFTMEQQFKITTKAFEFTKNEKEEIEIIDKPLINLTRPYNEREEGRFSNLFATGASSN